MNHNQRLLEFLKKENITPKNLQTYILATTHKSYNIKDKTKLLNYERLEFLGDSLLAFVTAWTAFKKMPNHSQGELSRWKASAVQTETLSEVSKKLNLLPLLKTGPGQMKEDVINSPKVQADIFESMVGAICYDQGTNRAIQFIYDYLLNPNLEKDIIDNFSTHKDPKTELQEHFQSMTKNSVHYVLEEIEDKKFYAKVYHSGILYGEGIGHSKKEAETNAAKQALEKHIKKGE
ncbi:ribonuclease III [Mycoplasmopsis felis]|uniref:Ribonuclease 3 n=1 Tax=Mycoplasmopsis felis TaxID=33923 RepID=A0A809S041_9BACT|nr:ribonuclease III [Mycoplasmopsis felis]WQQ02271.1 ribonuclease III [Mycoplasmopsis felis]WQQ05592.1 ribonuclease III [Mycoplasmopsis felis]WQQ07179.1 ribonuclease III [Mycoplasmopsis felis]WQQ07661.1 ribonuclease III [Mycoplasmopsis felis]WQQ08126.1 ribonuclease III [Mycoplasmopsis felis]